jgi:hypothetical protein
MRATASEEEPVSALETDRDTVPLSASVPVSAAVSAIETASASVAVSEEE